MAGELAFYIVVVGAGDHHHEDVQLQQVLQGARHRPGVGRSVLHRGAVPVEDDYTVGFSVHIFILFFPLL